MPRTLNRDVLETRKIVKQTGTHIVIPDSIKRIAEAIWNVLNGPHNNC